MFEDNAKAIILAKRNNKWNIELWKISGDVENFEKLLKRHKEEKYENPLIKRKLQDYKILFIMNLLKKHGQKFR